MKSILITGVSSGIGYTAVKYFLEQGFQVFGSVRKPADAKRLQADFSQNFCPLLFDVCDKDAIDKAVPIVTEKLNGRGLTCLVNNAGTGVMGPLQHLSMKEVHFQMDVNVYGPLRVIQAFLPLLGGQIPPKYPAGKIINISSVSGFFAAAFVGAYAMSKYALEAMTDSLRRELSIYGIDVLSIQPGAVATSIIDKGEQGLDPKFLETDYEPILKDWDKRMAGSKKHALPPVQVSQLIHQCIETDRPPARQIIAKKKEMLLGFKNMSDRELDALLTKGFWEKANRTEK